MAYVDPRLRGKPAPSVSVEQMEKGHVARLAAMKGFISDAVGHGAEVQTGGDRIGDKGFFFAPTVLTGADQTVAPSARHPE